MYVRCRTFLGYFYFSCDSVYPFGFSVMFFWLPYFFSKIVRFLLHPIVSMFSCHLLPVVGRIFFHCFAMFCFVSIALPFVDIPLIFLLSPVLPGLFPEVVFLSKALNKLLLFFWLVSLNSFFLFLSFRF